MNASVSFTVLGKPAPAGSKRAFPNPKTGGVIVTEDSKRSRPWKQAVAAEAHNAMAGAPPLDGALEMELVFVLARPKSHYGTGANAAKVKSSAPSHPATRPDSLKLARGTEDALSGIVYRDDAQVVDQRARKVYGLPERCEVGVRPVGFCDFCGGIEGHSARCAVARFGFNPKPPYRSVAA